MTCQTVKKKRPTDKSLSECVKWWWRRDVRPAAKKKEKIHDQSCSAAPTTKSSLPPALLYSLPGACFFSSLLFFLFFSRHSAHIHTDRVTQAWNSRRTLQWQSTTSQYRASPRGCTCWSLSAIFFFLSLSLFCLLSRRRVNNNSIM